MIRFPKVLSTLFLATVAGIASQAQFETRSINPSVRTPWGAAAGDFNSDGKPDFVVSTCIPTNQVSVMLGNGDGTLQAPSNFPLGGCPDAPAVGDFNGDGNLDLAVTDSSNGSVFVSVLLGNGDGTFQSAVSYPVPTASHGVTVGDFNDDRKSDLIMVGYNNISVLLGNGDGTFQEPPIVTTPPAGRTQSRSGTSTRTGF